MLAWFNAENAKAFGTELADFYLARVQKAGTLARAKVTERKQKELLVKLSKKIEQFKINNKLNFYQKAKAINKFKWCLLDSGFEKAYVDELSDWVARQI